MPNKYIDSVIEAYQAVAVAPDTSLSPHDAWMMAAAYVAEFTARQLFHNGLIKREEASPVFTATGGDHGDIQGWCKNCEPKKPEVGPDKEVDSAPID